MACLILNRRCPANPERGGAEKYLIEMSKGFPVESGPITWVSSRVKGMPQTEKVGNLRYVRLGNEITCHFYGFVICLRNNWELIIDGFNGVGFFTFAFKNRVLLIHQLYSEFWRVIFPKLGSLLEYLEKFFLKLYLNCPTITVSASTKTDLEALGFKDVTIIENGCDEPKVKNSEKETTLTLAYLGRIKRTKNPDDAINAYMEIKKKIPEAKLWIIGDGPELERMRSQYTNCTHILFYGYVEDSIRDELLSRAHFLLVPSIREGWGQVVIQANACGTPAIGYDVPGLRDSIIHNKTGILVKDYQEMAKVVLELWTRHTDFYKALCYNAKEWAKNFSWEKTRKAFIDFLESRGFLKGDLQNKRF